MAKANTALRVRKKVRKTISEGIVHLLIILSLLLPIAKGMRYLGLLLVVPVLKVRAKVHHSLLKSQQKQLVKLPKSMVLRI